jgi:hypothetical protein
MITLHLPKGENFSLNEEISLARNIQDSTNRKNTVAGLIKMQQYL